jgi:hypothetical protein
VTILILIMVFAIAISLVYTQTREAYIAVGFNNGQIHQREVTWKSIQSAVVIQHCQEKSLLNLPVELLAVKAESLYLITMDKEQVQFCRR